MKQQRFVAITFYAMRIGFLQLFLALFFSSYAYDYAADAQGILDKTVSISVEKGQLKDVFFTLKNQTGARFVYSSKTIEAARKVSIKANQKKLSEVLEELLTPFGITFKLVKDRIILYKIQSNAFFNAADAAEFTVQLTSAANQEVKGQITDDKGNPLAGVSVVIKGTTTGTNTDATGSFTLSVPEGKTILVISSVGFQTQEIDITGKTTVTIALVPNAGQLSDIVVVGYGTQKKVTVTGAVAQVKGSDLAKSPSINLSNALAGRLPGVTAINATGEPGYDGSTIRIRGSNTPNNSGALIVIDGVPDRAGGLERLNPADIESMSVLKDAAAAIYGARAANGVILITTKRGKSGRPQLSYDFNQGWAQPTRVPEMSDAVEYATIINELTMYEKTLPEQWGAAWNAFTTTGSYTRPDNGVKVDATYSPADIQKYRDGSDPWGHPNTDWFKTTLKNWSPQTRHNVQLSGGSDAVKYLGSVGYQNQDGYYKNSATGYKQYDLRFNLDAKVNKYINTSLGLTAREEFRFFPTVGAQPIFRMLMRGKPTEQEVWPNGLPGPDIENGQNPIVITTNQTGYDKDRRDYFQSNGRIEIQVPGVQGLKLTGFAAVDRYFKRVKRWETPWYLYFWDKVSYEADGVTPKLTRSVRSTFTDPRLTESQEDQLNINLSGFINYDKTFGPHTINLLAAVTRETIENQTFNAFRRNFVSTALDQLLAGGEDAQKNNNGSAYKRARLSYFGRVNYNFQEKYLAEFLWRYDGSYMFPESDRFGFFPGILVGWRISEENFFKPVSFIDNLKLRASWGQMGNDNILFNDVLQEYKYLSTYGFNTYIINGNQVKTLTETGLPNPGYTWEVANNTNIGIEGSALNSRLTFELDYFNNIRTKILMQNSAVVPATAGVTLPPENLGKIKNRGFEFNIGYNDHFGDFRFSVSVNGGYAKNKIINLPETPGLKPHQLSRGKTFGTNGAAYLAYEYDGVFIDQADIDKNTIDYSAATNKLLPGDMKIKDVDGNGKINADDRVRLEKNRDPWFTGGLNMFLQYKNFDCTILFQGATGGLLFIGLESGTIGNFLQYAYDHRWTVENPSSVDPRLANRGNMYYAGGAFGFNTYWLRSSNYLRMKNIEFGYNMPAKISEKAGITNLRLYVNGTNLVTFDKMKIWDPESTRSDGQYYPQARVLNIGARVTF
jgi:TonB-linked SusC/RagA family outer membrane protein